VKKYLYYAPHILTLIGLGFSASAMMSILSGNYIAAARFSLLVLLVDRLDGTMARKFKVKEKFPGTSGGSARHHHRSRRSHFRADDAFLEDRPFC
jgi:phosphatidylserine synthase